MWAVRSVWDTYPTRSKSSAAVAREADAEKQSIPNPNMAVTFLIIRASGAQ